MSHVWLIELKFITVRLSTIALRMVLKLSLLEKFIFWRFEISDRHNSSIRHGIQIFFSKIKNSTRLMHKFKISNDSSHQKCLKSASTKHEIYMKSRYKPCFCLNSWPENANVYSSLPTKPKLQGWISLAFHRSLSFWKVWPKYYLKVYGSENRSFEMIVWWDIVYFNVLTCSDNKRHSTRTHGVFLSTRTFISTQDINFAKTKGNGKTGLSKKIKWVGEIDKKTKKLTNLA